MGNIPFVNLLISFALFCKKGKDLFSSLVDLSRIFHSLGRQPSNGPFNICFSFRVGLFNTDLTPPIKKNCRLVRRFFFSVSSIVFDIINGDIAIIVIKRRDDLEFYIKRRQPLSIILIGLIIILMH